jgi:hypothetical protein
MAQITFTDFARIAALFLSNFSLLRIVNLSGRNELANTKD